MSQSEPDLLSTDVFHEVPIDAAGEIARYRLSPAGVPHAMLVELQIEGDAAASYSLEFGAPVSGTGSVRWSSIPDDFSYESTDIAEDAWQQSRPLLRVMVDTPATSGDTAYVYVGAGELG